VLQLPPSRGSPELLERREEKRSRVWEAFELNQLISAPSQLLPVFFSGFDRLQTCCHQFGPANINIYIKFLQVPVNFFFIVMTTGQELGH
jgi:hypothetical protein